MTSLRSLLVAAAVAMSSAGCAFDGDQYPQSSVTPTSDFTRIIHDLYGDIFWWSVLILTVVWVVLAYVLIRFRARPDSPKPKQIHGHMGLEIGWTIAPALIVVAIAIPTIQAVFATQQGDPENSLVVDVIGHQFWWEFRYPDTGLVTANEVHIPVDRPVSFRISSADVIHSFWVPMLGGKRDANPVRMRPEGEDVHYNWIHLTANETGTFWGQCAEFCGEAHSLMGFRVVVQTPEEFQAWQADLAEPVVAPTADVGGPAGDAVGDAPGDGVSDGQAGGTALAGDDPDAAAAPATQDAAAPATPAQIAEIDPLVEQGREIFHSQTCVACHAIAGTNAQGEIAPNLTLFGRRTSLGAGWLDNTLENLEEWIRAPQDIKPGALMPGVAAPGGNWPATNLTDEQVRAVAAYLYSLR